MPRKKAGKAAETQALKTPTRSGLAQHHAFPVTPQATLGDVLASSHSVTGRDLCAILLFLPL